MTNGIVYLNGRYLPLNEAKISVLDRGFLFGDGIYEVIPSYSGRLFRFIDHINRLNSSLNAIRLVNPHDTQEWLDILSPLIDRNIDQYIYLQVTRGEAEKRDHGFPKNIRPTVFALATNIVPFAELNSGIKAITIDDRRWQLCHVKAITLLANVLNRQEALDHGCAEAILVRDGHVTEGAASNVFAIFDGVPVTPPKSHEILPGITRDVILEIAKNHGIAVREEVIPLTNLAKAEEIWITSSVREIVPVVELDFLPVGNGKPGPLWQAMNSLFQTYKKSTL